MRALWLVRENLTRHPGGDTTQILQSAQALRTRGVQVDLCSEPRPHLGGYDIVHLVHLDRLWENVPHCRMLRRERRPAVLSPIYWPPDEFDRAGRAGVQGLLARACGSRTYENLRLWQRWAMHVAQYRSLHSLRSARATFRAGVRYVLDTVALLLPNSHAEREQIEQRFGIRKPAVIVPNAADVATFGPPAPSAGPRDGVLCVGRIEPRKNQLALIQALRDKDIPLTLVGQGGRFSRAYERRCRRAAGANVHFLGYRLPEALHALYHAARVHACVSWYETPGLASLEAALCGCALVVTPGGCTREYFGDDAHYCQPDDPASIRTAVENALRGGASDQLPQRVAHEFTWEAAAEKTLSGYTLALRP